VTEFRYEILNGDDQRALMRDRLRRLEADYFRLCLELRLAATVGGETDEVALATQHELAAIEVKASALRSWLSPPRSQPTSNGNGPPATNTPARRRTKKETGDA
jgi:hypothetical protein